MICLYRVNIASLHNGTDTILSRLAFGSRGLLLVRTSLGELALVFAVFCGAEIEPIASAHFVREENMQAFAEAVSVASDRF